MLFVLPYNCMVKESTQNLTPQQQALWEYVVRVFNQRGVPPSYREIQKQFQYKSVGTVQDHVQALLNKGFLKKTYNPHSKRAIGFIPQYASKPSLAVLGEVAAGSPRESFSVELGTLNLGYESSPHNHFALRVVGDSMIEVGILEGDHVIVQKDAIIQSGDIVVAVLEGEVTVKRLQKKKGKVFLVPENKTMSPIEVETADFHIQGKVISLQRKF